MREEELIMRAIVRGDDGNTPMWVYWNSSGQLLDPDSDFGVITVAKYRGKYLNNPRIFDVFSSLDPSTFGIHLGLYDDNGTPIFQGDRCAIDQEPPYVVWFDDGSFYLQSDEVDCDKILYCPLRQGYIDRIGLVVVGNIYGQD